MTLAQQLTPIRRILVALDASRASVDVLEAAAAMAAQLEAELEGLYVEDINLLRLAGLPFSREVGLASARSRRVVSADVGRALRREAERARHALEVIATRRQVHYSFRVARGQVAAELLAAAAQADLVALATASMEIRRTRLGSTARAMLASPARALLILPPREDARAALAIVYDGSPRASQVLALAGQIAHGTSAVTIFLLADHAEEEQRQRAEVTRVLAGHGIRPEFEWVVEVDIAQLARRVRELRVGTLLVAEDCPGLGRAGVHELLQAIDCAVLLLR